MRCTRWMLRTAVMAGGIACFAGAGAAAEFDDPEWPCIQRKVEEISMFQMWQGPLPEGDWRGDEEARRLASRIAPRRVTIEEAEAEARAFAETLDEGERAERLGLAFAAMLDQVQRERRQIIAGIGRYALRQASLSERVEAQQAELVSLGRAEDEDLDAIEELEDRLAWDARVYRERAQSLTYVCETPVLLEQRLFSLGRMLAGLI